MIQKFRWFLVSAWLAAAVWTAGAAEGDALLADMRLSATFRSDNVEGFVRLMESNFDLRAEWRGSEIVLRQAK
jgi:ferric-dicitrate binding protein FerR (iron transport regulator)